MLNDRLDNGKEFCRLMVIMSMSAIPIYLYLLVFALPHDLNLGAIRGIMLLSPAVTLLLAAIIFSLGFLLGKTHFTLDSIEAIEKMRVRIVRHRDRLILLAFICFTIGSVAAMAVIVKAHL